MPREFHFPTTDTRFWITTRFGESDYQASERTNNWLNAIGRLRAGVTLEQARAEMDVIAASVEAAVSEGEQGHAARPCSPSAVDVSVRSRLLLMALIGRRRVRAADCVRQSRQPAAGPRARTASRACRPHRDGGRTRATGSAVADRKPPACCGRRRRSVIAVAVASVPLLSQLVPTTLPIAASPSVDVRVLALRDRR